MAMMQSVGVWTRGVLVGLLLALVTFGFAVQASDADPADMEVETLAAKVMRHVVTINPVELMGEVTVDGILDEPFWEQATKVSLKLETYPALLKKAPVATDAWVLRVNDSIVIGFHAYDPDPEKIQAPLRDRDGIERDDYVGISFDTDGKMVRTYEFYVSASGVQADWLRNRVEDKRARDWDANWEAASRVTTNGYTVEMKIPLQEIDIPQEKELKRILTFKRHYPRDVRHHIGAFTIIESDPDNNRRLDKKVQLSPSVTYVPKWQRDPAESSDWDWDDQFEVSLDLEYRLTSSLGLGATINPNYLEVEGDLTEVSINDPFTNLDPEKRPFFTKGIDIFGSPFDLVYTRNIEDPRAGLKLGGTIGDVATGNFLADDRELSLIVPGNLGSKRVTLDEESYSGAFRYRNDIRRGLSLGALATIRDGTTDYHNHVAGFDIYSKLSQDGTLRAQWLYSDSAYSETFAAKLYDDEAGPEDPADDTGIPGETGLREEVLRVRPGYDYGDDAWQVIYKHKKRHGYVTGRYQDVGEDFRADLGYLPRVDYRSGLLSGGLDHYFSSEEKGVSRLRLSGNLLKMESQRGESITDSREIWLNYWGLLQSWARIGFRDRDRVARRVLQNTLAIDGNAPEFREQQWIFRFETAPLRNARLMLAGRFGDQIDTVNYRLGELIELEPELILNVSDRYELALKNTYRQLDVPDGGRVFTENYLRLNLTYQLDRGSFVRFTLVDDYLKRNPEEYLYDQVEETERDTSVELLFAWKPTQRNVFFLGVKGNAIDRDELSHPAFDETLVYIKYAKPFSL
jgi:hypothetical protein